ncbi:MAG: phage portal protein [Holosporaceae bacterium]|jgi:HK97 family phage portal protein|nr:phage portal protein [Holosporaceae bacterium]
MRNLLKQFGVGRKANGFFSYQGVNNPQWTPIRYDAISAEGFQKNAVVFRAINLISRGIASIPMMVKNVDDKTENLELTNFLNRPNKTQSRGAFLETMINYLLISGNAFIHCVENNGMNCLRTDRVRISPDASGTSVGFYIYEVDLKKFNIPADDVLHLKFFNPLNDWYGLSPLQIAARAVDQHNAISDHNLAILQNGGRPSGCLMVKNGDDAITDEQREQLRTDLQNSYAGAKNAGRIMVLEGSFEWKEMGLSPKDLDFGAGKTITSREIALAFGVPPAMLGLQESATFSSYREARLELWEDTILPLAELVRQEFGNWFSRKFGASVEIVFDLDALHALTSRREILWQKISGADFLTANEKREILGFPPLPNGDKLDNDSNNN